VCDSRATLCVTGDYFFFTVTTNEQFLALELPFLNYTFQLSSRLGFYFKIILCCFRRVCKVAVSDC
jgi:hypothetical protein